MFTDVFNEFIDKDVEVITAIGKSYVGTLQRSPQQEAIVISPHEGYSARRYGPIFIKESEVVSVREILPYVEEEGECENKQMIGPAPYKDIAKRYSPLASHDMGVDNVKDDTLDDLLVDEDV